MSLLWPRRQALLELLGVLNATEVASVWAEDETIGWVYQYFNGDEERTQMRKPRARHRATAVSSPSATSSSLPAMWSSS